MANDKKETLTEKWLRSLKNNTVIALLLIISVAIVGISTFSQAVGTLYRLVIPIGDSYESDLSKSIKKLESGDIVRPVGNRVWRPVLSGVPIVADRVGAPGGALGVNCVQRTERKR